MAGRGMGIATKGGGAVESGPKNKMISETSNTSGPVMMAKGGMDWNELAGAYAQESDAKKHAERLLSQQHRSGSSPEVRRRSGPR